MKKIDVNYKRHKNTPNLDSPSLKHSYNQEASMNDYDKCLERYLRLRERKLKIKKRVIKPFNNEEHIIGHDDQLEASHLISLDSDSKLNKVLSKKNSKTMQRPVVKRKNNNDNDRLVIELSDYLTLTKTNIGKFNLKPMTGSPGKVKKLGSIKDNKKLAKAVQSNQILKAEELTRTKVKSTDSQLQRTFLLVPENKVDTMKLKSALPQNVVIKDICRSQSSNKTNSTIKVFKNIFQANSKKSNTQSSSILKCSENVFLKLGETQCIQSTTQLPKKQSNHAKLKTIVHRDHQYSIPNKSTNPGIKKKKSSNVVLKPHPHFSQQEPLLIIRHTPTHIQLVEHNNYHAVTNNCDNFLNLDANLIAVPMDTEVQDPINYENPEENVTIIIPDESESINQVFPVALNSSDSDDFQYVLLQEDSEISNEDEMPILGI